MKLIEIHVVKIVGLNSLNLLGFKSSILALWCWVCSLFFSLFVLVAPSATIGGVCYLVPVASTNWRSFALMLRLMSNTEVGSGSVARPSLCANSWWTRVSSTEWCYPLAPNRSLPVAWSGRTLFYKESSSILPVSFLFSKSLKMTRKSFPWV